MYWRSRRLCFFIYKYVTNNYCLKKYTYKLSYSIFSETGILEEEQVIRACIDSSSLGEECVDGDVGPVGATLCFCTEDDCNKDKTCTCNSSSTIGISVMALLVCAYALFEMK